MIDKAIQAVIDTFPATFGLRGFPGKVFTLSERSSYETPLGSGSYMLYTQVDGVDFAKVSPANLRREIVSPPVECGWCKGLDRPCPDRCEDESFGEWAERQPGAADH